MIGVYSVGQVRLAEEQLMALLPEGTLMERASTGLAAICASLLDDAGPGVSGARIAVLTGSGNNGGDALYAGALLARRGARVDAVTLAERSHDGGREALLSAGGRVVSATDTLRASEVLVDADLVLDGIVGIGGSGPLRPLAAELVTIASDAGAPAHGADTEALLAELGYSAAQCAALRASATIA